MLMADEMSSSAWVLVDDECDNCGGPPPVFNLPPPPIPPNLPCELEIGTCPNILSIADAELKTKIGPYPILTFLIGSIVVSLAVLLVVGALIWKYFEFRKKKVVAQLKEFDHGPSMMNGNGVLYEDLAHARPRPPIAPPSIEMLDINHHPLTSDGIMGNPKLDFAYFLNPPPIYEELPDHHSDRNNGLSDDEFAEDELSVIDVPVSHEGDATAVLQARYHNGSTVMANGTNGIRNGSNKPRAQSLNRKQRGSARNGGNGGTGVNGLVNGNGSAFKSQRSLDRRGRNGSAKYNATATNPRGFSGRYTNTLGGDNNNPGSMLILSNQNGMTMKIPPHLLAVLTESAMCNGGGARPYEIIPTSMGSGIHHGTLPVQGGGGGANPGSGPLPNGMQFVGGHGMIAGVGNGTGIYPSSRSSGSSYGDGGSSSASSARNNQQGKNIESSSFDSGIGPNSITSFINSPAYDQAILPPAYSLNTYEYASAGGENGGSNGMPPSTVVNPAQYLQNQQHASFRRLRMTPADRDHPLYSNHLLT